MDSATLSRRRVRDVIGDLPVWVQATVGTVVSAAAVAFLPGMALAAGIVGWAWYYGWPSTRMRNVALTVVGATAVGAIVSLDPVWPYHYLQLAMQQAWSGQWPQAITNALGAELVVSTLVAWWWWHGYTKRMRSGTALEAGERHQKRQRKARERVARKRSKWEPTPLSRDGRVVLGQRSEDVYAEVRLAGEQLTQRHGRWIDVTVDRIKLHMAALGQTGVGKSTLLARLSAGWTDAAWRQYDLRSSQGLSGSTAGSAAGGARPLTIFVEAKGGREAAEAARSWADVMEAVGLDPERVGVFPFEQRLNMWHMPAKQLRASLHALAGTDHRFYDVLQRGLLHLAIDDPVYGPPTSSAQFLQRLNEDHLRQVWKGWPVELQMVDTLVAGQQKGQASPLGNDLILFADLFRSLGGDFDAGRPLSDFDALYVSLPGTVDGVVAEAKAAVMIELLMHELSTNPREVLFVLDEFSAVSGEVAGTVVNLVERLRSAGGSVIVSAQSYQGLASTDTERERLLNAMGGGMLVMRTQGAEPLAKRAGTRKVGEASQKLDGQLDAGEGSLRRQDAFLLDPNRVRQMPEYHVAYALPEHVQYGVVTPLEDTKRLASRAIVESPQRALPVAGDAVPFLQLRADQDQQIRGWSV